MATKAITWTTKPELSTVAGGVWRVTAMSAGQMSQSQDIPADGPYLAVFTVDPGEWTVTVQRLDTNGNNIGASKNVVFSVSFTVLVVDVVSATDQ